MADDKYLERAREIAYKIQDALELNKWPLLLAGPFRIVVKGIASALQEIDCPCRPKCKCPSCGSSIVQIPEGEFDDR